ncbi:hypothetical protein L195_g056683, partial [Trifolium pratense]
VMAKRKCFPNPLGSSIQTQGLTPVAPHQGPTLVAPPQGPTPVAPHQAAHQGPTPVAPPQGPTPVAPHQASHQRPTPRQYVGRESAEWWTVEAIESIDILTAMGSLEILCCR